MNDLCSLLDYLTANDPTLTTPLTEDERSDLYAELASGAETGWDYSSRWVNDITAGGTNNTNPILRTLNVRNIIPVCLNSILCKCLRFPTVRSLFKITHRISLIGYQITHTLPWQACTTPPVTPPPRPPIGLPQQTSALGFST